MPTGPDVTRVYTPELDDTRLSQPAGGVTGEVIGGSIGPYKLLELLGEGGMGSVFLAEQEQPVRRQVALKVVKAGMDSAAVIARFEAERQALAMMEHLHIARVLDAGTTAAGRPYFAMELVHGIPITKYCDEHRLTTRQRLELFVPVCQAIQHAHQKGIIHRDIKPSNVLVTLFDGKAVPKVIDFGLAKATQQTATDVTQQHTQFGAVVGTLEYMSPEQAELSPLGVDTRSDIYSLGALLYELLTGSTPLGRTNVSQASFTELLRRITQAEPPRPSATLHSSAELPAIAAARHTEPAKLRRLIQGDLDWIVMKCLEKDRTRRYESAADLARDIERYLNDEPVEACPPSAGYRLKRFARKYRKALAAAAAFVLLLLGGIVVSSWQAIRATRAEQQMQHERDRTRLGLTRQVAERLNGDLQELAASANVLAATVAQRSDWQEQQLADLLGSVLQSDRQMFALNIGFEPKQFQPERDDFCLYVFHGEHGIETKQLLPPAYVPLYREWDWYTKPRDERRAQWSEPYVDTGGGDIPMVTFTAPIMRDDKFAGVLSLDLSVEYFEVLRKWLEELNLGAGSYGFVLSPTGLILSHPDADYDFARRAIDGKEPRVITKLNGEDPAFAALARQMLEGKFGSGQAIDPATKKPSTFIYAPVPSAGWTFVAVIEQ